MKKKLLAMVLAGVMAVSFTACGSGDDSSSGGGTSAPDSDSEESSGEDQPDAGASSSSADAVTLQIGFENSISEPIGQALEKWQSLVEEKGDGSLKLELYPDSQHFMLITAYRILVLYSDRFYLMTGISAGR